MKLVLNLLLLTAVASAQSERVGNNGDISKAKERYDQAVAEQQQLKYKRTKKQIADELVAIKGLAQSYEGEIRNAYRQYLTKLLSNQQLIGALNIFLDRADLSSIQPNPGDGTIYKGYEVFTRYREALSKNLKQIQFQLADRCLHASGSEETMGTSTGTLDNPSLDPICISIEHFVSHFPKRLVFVDDENDPDFKEYSSRPIAIISSISFELQQMSSWESKKISTPYQNWKLFVKKQPVMVEATVSFLAALLVHEAAHHIGYNDDADYALVSFVRYAFERFSPLFYKINSLMHIRLNSRAFSIDEPLIFSAQSVSGQCGHIKIHFDAEYNGIYIFDPSLTIPDGGNASISLRDAGFNEIYNYTTLAIETKHACTYRVQIHDQRGHMIWSEIFNGTSDATPTVTMGWTQVFVKP